MEPNNVTLDLDTTLPDSSDRKVKDLIQMMVFVSILLFIGLFGNISALVFFFRKAKDNVSLFFIITLAIIVIIMIIIIISLFNEDNIFRTWLI